MIRYSPLIVDARVAKSNYWDKVIPYMQNEYGVTVDNSAGSGKQFFYVSHDPDVVWQPGATPIKVKGCGFDSNLAMIGDHPAGVGLNEALISATSSGVAHGLGDDEIKLAIEERIAKAYWAGSKRRDEVVERVRRGKIDETIKSARAKFTPVKNPVRTVQKEEEKHKRQPFEWIDEPDLRQKKFPPLKWYAKNLLYQGIVILAGRPKKGKSYLATLISVQLAGGHDVLGQYEVDHPVKTVYFTLEDGPELMKDRITKMSPKPLPHLRIVTKTATIADGFMDDLGWLIDEGYKVFVVDVLTKIETRSKEGAKTYGEVYEMFEALQEKRKTHDIAIIFVYHTRKMKGESDEETIMGSTGYSAVTDANWVLKVDSDEEIAALTIDAKRMRSRTIEMKTAFEGMGWTVQSDGRKDQLTKEEREVIDTMIEDFPEATPNQLANALGINRNTMVQRLNRMWKRGHIDRVPRKKGHYRLKNNTFPGNSRADIGDILEDDVPFS